MVFSFFLSSVLEFAFVFLWFVFMCSFSNKLFGMLFGMVFGVVRHFSLVCVSLLTFTAPTENKTACVIAQFAKDFPTIK